MRSLLRFVAIAAMAAFLKAQSTPLKAQSALAPAPAATVIDVSPPGGTYSEPSIATDPANPSHVVVVYQVGAFAAYSTDAGKSFHAAPMAATSGYKVLGDVSTTFDNQGHAFLCYLGFDRLGTEQYWAHNVGRNGIYVRRSLNGGKTWENNPTAIKDFPTGHEAGIQFEDQARIFADTGKNSRFVGNLYAGWIEWELDQSIMLFSRSVDDGKTWSPAIRISTHAGLPRDDNGSVSGFHQAIAGDGTIYAVWHDGNWITMTESHDGGKAFSKSRPVVETAPPYFSEVTGVYRVSGFPQIAIDPQGRLYLCWSDYRNGDIDVFVASSADHGKHWSKPVRVNDDPLHDGCDQFFQWMAVDPVTGAVYVQFYDRRGDPKNAKIGFTLARSTDGARTFVNYSWARKEFEGKNAFLGDYTWLTAYDGRVLGAWTEARSDVTPQDPAGEEPGMPRVSTVIRVGTADFSALR